MAFPAAAATAAGAALIGTGILLNTKPPQVPDIGSSDEGDQENPNESAPASNDGKNSEEENGSPLKPVDVIAPDGKLIGIPGNGPDVQVMPDGYKGKTGLQGAEELYGDLTNGQGGKDVTPPAYDGTLTQLPNGDYIGIRPVSGNGEPAVDTKISGAPKGYVKFKFPN